MSSNQAFVQTTVLKQPLKDLRVNSNDVLLDLSTSFDEVDQNIKCVALF